MIVVAYFLGALETCSRLRSARLVPSKVEPCGACRFWILFGQIGMKGMDVALMGCAPLLLKLSTG